MMTLVPFFAYVVVFASLPLVYATLKTATPEKLRDRVFLKSVFKDYLRTVPICALICLPVLVFPRIVCAYAICLHLVFALPLALELGHVHLFGTRVGINTFYSLFVTNVRETREFFRQSVSVAQRLLILATWFLPVFFLWRLDAGRAAEDPLRMMWIVGFAAAAVPFFVNLHFQSSPPTFQFAHADSASWPHPAGTSVPPPTGMMARDPSFGVSVR